MPNGEIHHPKPGRKMKTTRFTTFGLADKGVLVGGTLIGDTTKIQIPGLLILLRPSKQPRSRDRMFWALHFLAPLPVQDDSFTLHLFDQANPGKDLAISDGLKLPQGGAAGPKSGFGIDILYPTAGDCPLPQEFIACGTTSAGGAVSGTMTNVDPASTFTQLTPPIPPPNWNLDCNVVNPVAPSSVLTVSQGGINQPSDPLTFS